MEVKFENEKEKKTMYKSKYLGFIIGIIVVISLFCVFYILGNKDENSKETGKISNEEAINIAKTKLEAANNLIGSFGCDYDYENKIENAGFPPLCYYDTYENFKTKFYEVYSSNVMINDVYAEYDIINNKVVNFDVEKHNEDEDYMYGVIHYVIKDYNIFINNFCRADGRDNKPDNWEVVSVDNNKIIVKYDVYMSISDDATLHEESITLVKENNEWKIEHATILSQCGIGYRVGK